MEHDLDLLTRRAFLRTSLLGAALSWTIPVFLERTFLTLHAQAADSSIQTMTGKDHPILVVLQLAGGNDGLNTIIPLEDDLYFKSRPTLATPKEQVLALDGSVGLNPSLTPLKSLYDDGNLAIIQGVGYPNPNRSHFRSTEIWQTASDAQQNLTKGWIGRYFDNCCAGEDPEVGVVLGEQLPEAFNAASPTGVAIGRPGNLGFDRGNDPDEARLFAELNGLEPASMSGDSIGNLSGPSKSGLSALEYLQRTALDAQVSTDKIKRVLKGSKNEGTYPKSQLGNSLALISRLIAGGLPTRVYYASQGGYDTHAGQINTHKRLLNELSAALAAFCQDLKTKGIFDRVLVMTFSEFGRRVIENANGGTDHGTAAPMFVCGGSVKPGLYGKQPPLDRLDAGDLFYNVDFRSVYSTILSQWMKAPAAQVLGRDFPKLNLI
ncbi:MAG TPA: DUF1501 domain-containing protein [Chthoniobacterales bacterium]|jgi:uncharacterized protein (DUF1501 family)|nr:DUF1501 domain-containing protein [Chthoniobacterales bacterium]